MRMFSMSLYIRLHADYKNAREPCNTNGTNAWFKSKSGWVKLLIITLYFARFFCKWCLSIMLILIADSLFMHNIGVFVFCKKLRKLERWLHDQLFSFILVFYDFILLLLHAGALCKRTHKISPYYTLWFGNKFVFIYIIKCHLNNLRSCW